MKEGTIMKKLLYISVNSKPEDLSASKTVARKFINKFLQKNKDFQVEEIDLYKEHIPRLEYQYFEKRNCIVNEDDAKKLNDKDQKEVQRIRALCDQFISANVYVIAAPMWSLSFPAPLKEYIDCIMQDQKTIKFEGKKIEPLLNDKPRTMVYIQSSGGNVPWMLRPILNKGLNYVEDIIKFMGIKKFEELLVDDTGFTEEEVREMLTYYSTTSPFNHTIDELIEIMKPWYDNYCFAQECYGETTMYNSNMVLYFVKNYISRGKAPLSMVEENIRIDYEKLRMLIRKDKEFAHDASVIQTLVSQGFITGELKSGFPASGITNPDNFVSLLYYFGMLTINGMHRGKTKLIIPNLVVQEQLYTYLLSTYNEADLSFSSYEKSELSSQLAYDGNWKAYFDYIADCLKTYASQRDKQKGEFFVHGFTLAMTAQNRFYRPISEQDTQAGYVDIFLCPMLDIYSDMTHSYIVELKYAKYKDPETRVEELRQEAIAQANRYADTDTVKRAIGSTRLHKIVVVYKGMEMRVCEEIQ